MTQKVIVTGSNGQLGSCLREIAPQYKNIKFIFTDIAELDITDEQSVRELFEREKPQWVINAAAYTAVDKAETDRELAHKLNATAVGILARESGRVGAGFIHISTDYVFDGKADKPLSETDEPNPQSVYGATKLEGEKLAAANAKCVILRTAWLYSIYGNNFVKTMRRLGAEKSEIGVVGDQWGSPTSAHDLAAAIVHIIKNPVYGLYHFSNEGATSWAIFAEQIMDLSGLNCEVNHISTAQYPTPAARPAFSLMSKQKFSDTFDFIIPEWEDSLEKVIDRLNKQQ